ncbi:uncharacterized protein [Danio rerio]|uniref:Uncharacterized protein n=1 Tax=Danio rerio TaxID=7955 RepID=A0A8M1RSB2_DANRE|nr:uncharacterized protein LOC558721 [Danio rerio]|eukprot:XP_003197778.1 uncharacterized protein LOC558721 [Danio rerio]
MVKGTLNELSQLKQSGFGQPEPRHGLNLLYWFAREYVDIGYGEIIPKSSYPENGDFGFHKFNNRIEDEDHIVPIQNLPYYEVGNLNYRNADELPDYVRGKYSRNTPDSNKDRIIVRQDGNGKLSRVYVTEHSDAKLFDSSKTYRVSQGLLQIINNRSREDFLSEVSNARPPPPTESWQCIIL